MPTTNRTLAIAPTPAAAEVLAAAGTLRNSNRSMNIGNKGRRSDSSSRYKRNITDISRSNRAGTLEKMGLPATAGTSATHDLM
jgi:hypothetical protein